MKRSSLTADRQLGLGWCFACFCFGFAIVSTPAESGGSTKESVSSTQKESELPTDNLQKQITDLDSQIQKLREKSLELQEKTRAKLQAQLDNLKKQRDTLIPRIEKLRDNSEIAWQDIKVNIQKAIEDLKTSVDSMEK